MRKFALPWLAAGLSLLVAQGAAAAQAVSPGNGHHRRAYGRKTFPSFLGTNVRLGPGYPQPA